ncbi:MAG: hypothetical protein KF823_10290 [Xanthomonadales bacterium]|nr:hypothetical protein [Xanthomonadales bacterium]
MRRRLFGITGLIAMGLLCGSPAALAAGHGGTDVELAVPTLHGSAGGHWDAPEADQGVAVDEAAFYAIDNTLIARYSRADGSRTALWDGSAGPLIHINSCQALAGKLWCAHSNYPGKPMTSSVEVFDSVTLTPVGSHSLGYRTEGSLVWLAPVREGWLAGFAHYDGKGGEPGHSQRYSGVVQFDSQWRRSGGWVFPDAVLQRMAPHAASGGAIGPDGWLYTMGHDRGELYVLGKPRQGSTLVHLATIEIPAEGQAFSWLPDARAILVVLRHQQPVNQVRRIDIPALPKDVANRALPFERSLPTHSP